MQQKSIKIIEQNMSHTLKSEATTETYRKSLINLHNCPSCRCKSTEAMVITPMKQSAFISIRSHTLLEDRKAKNNLYLSHDLSSYNQTGNRPTFNIENRLSRKQIKAVNSPKASPMKVNITFSYASPTKQQSFSSEARFVTKTFKKKPFPGLDKREEEPTKTIVRHQKPKKSTYYETYSSQVQSPRIPKILQLNKAKSKQKLQLTLSKNSENKKSIKDQVLSNKPYNDYGIQMPQPTPINALWQLQNRASTNNALSYSQVICPKHQPRISIDNIQLSRIEDKESGLWSSSQKMSPFGQSLAGGFQVRKSSQKSIQSHSEQLNVQRPLFQSQHITVNKNECKGEGVKQNSNLRPIIFKDKSVLSSEYLSMGSADKEEFQLAQQLSQELSLHYDYYRPMKESDRSLSLNYAL